MMNKKEFIESQKECAKMLGMSLSEYEVYCKNLKVPKDNIEKIKKGKKFYDFLKSFGLEEKDLKVRKVL